MRSAYDCTAMKWALCPVKSTHGEKSNKHTRNFPDMDATLICFFKSEQNKESSLNKSCIKNLKNHTIVNHQNNGFFGLKYFSKYILKHFVCNFKVNVRKVNFGHPSLDVWLNTPLSLLRQYCFILLFIIM